MQFLTPPEGTLVEAKGSKNNPFPLPGELQQIIFEYVGTLEVESTALALEWRSFSKHVSLRLFTSEAVITNLSAETNEGVKCCDSVVVRSDEKKQSMFNSFYPVLVDSNSQLKVLDMSNIILQDVKLLTLLHSSKALKELYLSNCGIDSDSGIAIGKALSSNRSLEKLDLSSNMLCSTGMSPIIEALKTNNSLRWLDIADNSDASETGMEECARKLGEVLKINTSLVHLNVSENDIGNDGATWIAAGLKENKTLINVNVFGQYILHVGIVALAETLKVNSSLQVLDVGSCHAYLDTSPNSDYQPGIALGQALKINSSLKELNLTHLCFGTEDTINLCEGLKVNSGLERLNLLDNLVGSKGLMALADALSHNKTLRDLNIESSHFYSGGNHLVYPDINTASSNEFIIAGYNELALSLKTNSSLRNLWIGADQISRVDAIDIASCFAQCLVYNVGLKALHLNFEGLTEKDVYQEFQESRKYNSECRIYINGQEVVHSNK